MKQRITIGTLALCLATSAIWLSGCGSSDEPEEGGAEQAPADQTPAGTAVAAVTPKNDLNIFFDNPLQVASDQTAVGSGAGGGTPGGGESGGGEGGGEGGSTAEMAEEPPASAAAAGALAWAELIPVEQVEAGIKNCRNELSRRLVNLGAYNGSYLEIVKFGAALSFLAEVARQHEGDFGWKDKAHMVRALGQSMVEVTSGSTARGKKGYDAVNNAFLTVCEILDGNDPAAPPEADVEVGIAEAAEMSFLMQVIERQLEWLQNNAGSEDAFKDNAELVMREAALLAAIAEAFNVEDYGYGPAANDEEFEGYTYGLRDAAKAMFKAAGSADFETYDAQRSAAAQKCAECHMVYRNG